MLAGVALLYSLWAAVGSGRDTLFWGLMLLVAGVPVYLWQVRRGGRGEPSSPGA